MDLLIDGGATSYKYIIFKDGVIYSEGKINGSNFMHGVSLVRMDGIPHNGEIEAIYLFGAGLRPEDDNSALRERMQSYFPQASRIYMTNDLDLAGLAFLEDEECIVGILGTGSNAALARRGILVDKIIAGGHFLGDQGSGFCVGRSVLMRYIEHDFSEEENALFYNQYGYTKRETVSVVIKHHDPKQFVAGFAGFVKQLNKDLQEDILEDCFSAYFFNVNKQIKKNNNISYNFVGGIAKAYEEELRKVAKSLDCTVNKILSSPLDEIEKIYQYIKANEDVYQ